MTKFSAALIAVATLFVGTQAAITPRAEVCPAGTIACGFDLEAKYGHSIEELGDLTPGDLSPWDSRFLCGENNTVASYVDTCAVGTCIGDHQRPGHDDAFCDAQ